MQRFGSAGDNQRPRADFRRHDGERESFPRLSVEVLDGRHDANDEVEFDRVDVRVVRPLGGAHAGTDVGIHAVVHQDVERHFRFVSQQHLDIAADAGSGVIAIDENEREVLVSELV